MFFAPPVVKAISRYSDFGSHLGVRCFGIMLMLAILMHAGLIGVYAMMPPHKVVKIPVRVLNINLGTSINETVPQSEQPIAEQRSASRVTAEEPAPVQAVQAELDKALSGESKSVMEHAIILPPQKKPKAPAKERVGVDKKDAAATGLAITMPKKYVRESPLDIANPKGAAAQSAVPTKPEEIVQRYEQAISLWISQHKVYPEDAKRRRVEGDAVVRVRINRQGKILYYVIDKSSGDAFIDHAVMGMVRASDPAPAVPDNYPEGEEFEFLVPVSFKLEK